MRALVKTVMNLRFRCKVGHYFTSWVTINFSRRTLPHRVSCYLQLHFPLIIRYMQNLWYRHAISSGVFWLWAKTSPSVHLMMFSTAKISSYHLWYKCRNNSRTTICDCHNIDGINISQICQKREYGVSKSIRTESIKKYLLTFGITCCCCPLQRVMAAKLTRPTHKIAI
jgi:hypothetical protein